MTADAFSGLRATIIRKSGPAIGWPQWERARSREQGLANLQYIRYGNFSVILASDGEQIGGRRRTALNQEKQFPANVKG